MENLLDDLAEIDAQAQSQPEKEALVQPVKHEDPPPPQRRLRRCSRKRSAAAAGATPTAGTKAGMMAATCDGTGSDNAWRRARGGEAEVIALKGKGKGGSAHIDGGEAEVIALKGDGKGGELQDNSEAAQTSGNRRQGEQRRPGPGRYGNKSKQEDAGWNKIFHTSQKHKENEALKLFKQAFPKSSRPTNGRAQLNGEGEADLWIMTFLGKVMRAKKQA